VRVSHEARLVLATSLIRRAARGTFSRREKGRTALGGDGSLRGLLGAVERDVEDRQHKKRQQGGDEQAAHDREGHRPPEHRRRDWDQAQHARTRPRARVCAVD